jgi:hypothetical protein
MPITIRRAEASDTPQCGEILDSALPALGNQHNFPNFTVQEERGRLQAAVADEQAAPRNRSGIVVVLRSG